jgi:hypothetical protein
MNKNILIVIVLLILGAVGAYFFLNKPQVGNPLTGNSQETVSASMADLLKMGKDYMCTFTTSDETTGTTNGTIYVADQGAKFGGTFITQPVTGTQTESHIVRADDYTYVWTVGETQGFKMKIDPEDDSLFPTSETDQTAIDDDTAMDFSCVPWRPQDSMFTVPTDIEFVDFSAQLEMMQQYAAPSPTDQGTGAANNCSVCAQLEGDTKTQCLAALGC